MRLSEQQIQTIRHLVREGFGADARVHVFGSRVNEHAIGGDIDLLVELPAKAPLATELRTSGQLQAELGIPVDLLTAWPGQAPRPIVEIARLTGVAL